MSVTDWCVESLGVDQFQVSFFYQFSSALMSISSASSLKPFTSGLHIILARAQYSLLSNPTWNVERETKPNNFGGILTQSTMDSHKKNKYTGAPVGNFSEEPLLKN